jgi:predicted enzyme related to lactoylglutathione lyase
MLGVALIKVPVADLARAVAFYEAAFGLQAKTVVEADGWALLDGISVALALYVPDKGGGNRPPGGSVDFNLSHDRIDELLQRVARVDPDAAIRVNDGSRCLELRDPDGNRLKVMQR